MSWKKFEKDCFAYIPKNFKQIKKLQAFGSSDSTKADIQITTQKNEKFYVEIKEPNAQCCQFVLFPREKTRSFEHSEKNKFEGTENRDAIIKYMNEHYDAFRDVGTAGVPIPVAKEILYGWVRDFYDQKDVKFFITRAGDYLIFPLEKCSHYFDIKAVYRKKTSGSAEPNAKNNSSEIRGGLVADGITGNIEFIKSADKKTRCFLHTDMELDKERMLCDKYTYQFKANDYSAQVSKQRNYVYEVRRLSNTSNPNVIFEITLKTNRKVPEDLAEFESSLE